MPVLSGSGPAFTGAAPVADLVLLPGTLVTLVVADRDFVVVLEAAGWAVTVWVVVVLGLWSAQAARASAQTANGRNREKCRVMAVGPPLGSVEGW